MARLTYRQERMLREMATLAADKLWLVSGHNRIACGRLVRMGLAEKMGDFEAGLSSAYRITPAGRAALSGDRPKEDSNGTAGGGPPRRLGS